MINAQTSSKTKKAIILGAILKEPFICIYLLLPFILLEEYKALAFQIVLLKSLSPIAALFSFYVSELVSRNILTLKRFLLISGVLARAAFIPALLSDNIYFYIAGSAVYMIFSRAEVPAWMEVIKRNIIKEQWEKSFSSGSIISYSTGVVFTILFSKMFASNIGNWKVFFLLALALSTLAVFIQVALIHNDQIVKKPSISLKGTLYQPIKDSFLLLKKNKSFRRFQYAFMIGGLGLMVVNTIIPIYFVQTLHVDYSSLLVAFCVCKSFGFILTTPYWNRLFSKITCKSFVIIVLFGFSIFSYILVFSSLSIYTIFLAYFVYGIAQAGSHLVWHLSGPLFAQSEQSSRYSGVNIIMVGVRGLIGPFIAMQLLNVFSAPFVFFLSTICTFIGGMFYLLQKSVDTNKVSV